MSTEISDKNVAKIDDDINKLNKFCEYEDAVVLCEEALYEIQEAIERILLEREQDKKKIQELEENKILLNSKVGIDLSYDDYISKQKIKDKIEDLRYNNKLGFEESLEEFFKIEVLEELLERE